MTMQLQDFVRKTKKLMVGNKEITFSELSLSDWAMFQTWAQERADQWNAKRRQQVLELAKHCGDIEPMQLLQYVDSPVDESSLNDTLGTFEGIRYLLWRSLKYAYPEATLDDAGMITSLNTFNELQSLFGIDGAEKSSSNPRKSPATGAI